MVEHDAAAGFVGGCPIGSLANELAETDLLAARRSHGRLSVRNMIRDGLKAIAARGELPERHRGRPTWHSRCWRPSRRLLLKPGAP